jgi:myosin protein heavy chain
MEREKTAHDRQREATRNQLDVELTKRAQLEQLVSIQRAELIKLNDREVKRDRDLNKALTDLKTREWEVKQLESKQDKTIVEHVHVLEEAKRVTDRQLAEAQVELQKNAAYIRSLEKVKSRLTSEAEDLARETERERVELRSKEKVAKAQEERATRALADVDRERRAKETAEQHSRRLQVELQASQNQILDLSQQMLTIQRSKNNLEIGLERPPDGVDAPSPILKMQRRYETRIAQLEAQLHKADPTKDFIARIEEEVQKRLQEHDISSSAVHSGISPVCSSLISLKNTHAELRGALEAHKSKAETYLEQLEAAETANEKATRAEAIGLFA